jgi:hypothetical protein
MQIVYMKPLRKKIIWNMKDGERDPKRKQDFAR